jgi:hypothetical protein
MTIVYQEVHQVDLLKMPGVVYCEFEKGDCIIRQGELKDGIIILDQEELAEFAQGNKLISY